MDSFSVNFLAIARYALVSDLIPEKEGKQGGEVKLPRVYRYALIFTMTVQRGHRGLLVGMPFSYCAEYRS